MKDLPPMVKLIGGRSAILSQLIKYSPAMWKVAPMALLRSAISAEGPVIRLVPKSD